MQFYKGGITLESIRSMTMFEVDQAVIFMNEEKKRESQRNSAK